MSILSQGYESQNPGLSYIKSGIESKFRLDCSLKSANR